MVAVITGSGLGVERSSAFVLGSRGALGQASLGRAGDNVYVNAATGNLVISNTDEVLIGRGLDAIVPRTYNSLGQFTDDNGDNWRNGLNGRLHTFVSGVSITRTEWDGAETVFYYDAAKGAFVSTAGGGAYDTMTYNAGMWQVTDGDTGVIQKYDQSNDNRIVSSTDRDGNVQSYIYNGNGQLVRVTNADGGYTELVYSGNLLTELITNSPATAGGTPAALTRVRYGYDGQSRLSTVTVDLTPTDNSVADGKAYVTTYTYDGTSKRVASISQTDGSRLDIAYVQVGADHRVASLTQTVSTGVTRATSFAYDTTNRTTAITDAAGQVTTLTYDAQGQLTKVVSPPAYLNGPVQTTQYAYNLRGDVVRIDRGDGDVSVYNYDANGNNILERDAAGNVVTRTYGTNNQLLTETRGTRPWTAPTVVFRNPNGTLSLRRADGTSLQETGTLPAPDTAWDKMFVGDTNGDGQLDIVFQRSDTSDLAVWATDGTQITGSGLLSPGAGWSVVSLGDFNGDGKSDILFQQAGSGVIGAWLMNGLGVIGQPGYGAPAAGLVFKGVGDFNGDGKSDVVFQTANNQWVVWTLNGLNVIDMLGIGWAGGDWTLATIADLDGDASSDLIFRHTNGTFASWLVQWRPDHRTRSIRQPRRRRAGARRPRPRRIQDARRNHTLRLRRSKPPAFRAHSGRTGHRVPLPLIRRALRHD